MPTVIAYTGEHNNQKTYDYKFSDNNDTETDIPNGIVIGKYETTDKAHAAGMAWIQQQQTTNPTTNPIPCICKISKILILPAQKPPHTDMLKAIVNLKDTKTQRTIEISYKSIDLERITMLMELMANKQEKVKLTYNYLCQEYEIFSTDDEIEMY